MVKLGDLLEENIHRKKIDESEVVTFIGMQDVSEDAVLKKQHKIKFSEVKKGLTFCKKNDILVAKITPCFENGKGANLDILETEYGFGSTEFHVLQVKEGNNSSYLYHQTRTEVFRERLEKAMVGTAGHKRVPFSAIKEFQLPFKHGQKEQTAIAKSLSDVDALIASLEKLIAKKQAIKTATMQQLLTGKKRLPGFGEGKGYKQTELGEIPVDWEIDRIGNILSITTGDKNTQDRIDEGYYPFFVRSQTIERINSYSFDGEAVLTAGDGVGTGKIFHYIQGKFDFHQRVYLMSKFNDQIDGFYFFKYFSNHFYDRIMSMTAKSSVDSVRREMIADMLIALPLIDEQREIVKVLSEMDSEVITLESRLSKTQQIKQGMMQELLTGKTRLI